MYSQFKDSFFKPTVIKLPDRQRKECTIVCAYGQGPVCHDINDMRPSWKVKGGRARRLSKGHVTNIRPFIRFGLQLL